VSVGGAAKANFKKSARERTKHQNGKVVGRFAIVKKERPVEKVNQAKKTGWREIGYGAQKISLFRAP